MSNCTKNNMFRSSTTLNYASSVLLLSLFTVTASECNASESAKESHDSGTAEHEWHKNHAVVFIGGMTSVGNDDDLSFAIGLDYERRFTDAWGLELRGDYTVGSHDRSALVVTNVTFRPLSEAGLKLMTGPGFEIEAEESHSTTVNFVYGVGAAWEFHLGEVSVAPTVYVDFLGESNTNVTFGLGIGTGF